MSASAGVRWFMPGPDTLKTAFQGVSGVFLVTNFWEKGTDEGKQATAAVHAARDAGVKYFI
ncbi:hypothetical protein A4H97_21555 [Niastella yeongjuensis]|uniref:Uncharacterized protein n=1 Tax=Niastella yeongjuensis TaxID=354355 RepID=A0A1V9F876_9BACT|nr:hypothetical protein A4H97_21555 [Niastella yeongjuensis]